MVKVMQVITKGESGGAQTHVFALCQALARQVHFVAVMGGREPHSFLADELQRLGIAFCHVPQLDNSLSPLRMLAAVRAMLRLLRTHRPAIIHAHSAVAGVVARIAGRITGTPVIYTVHGFGFKPEAPWPRRFAARLAETALAPITSHMICVSDHELQLARQLPIEHRRLTVIANGIPDRPERARATEDAMRIVMVARLASPKRPELLLQALALLRDRLGQELAASLIGCGPDFQAVVARARLLELQHVTFYGDVTDVPERLAQHQVFVLLSDHEGLPISIIEAMRAGLAIVASDLPGVRELIVHGDSGLLVANEPHALADALQSLLRLPTLRTQLGLAARQRYESGFTPEPMTRAVAALYDQITHHEPSPHPVR